MNDEEVYKPLHKRYSQKANEGQIENRKGILRNIQIYPDITYALGNDLAKQYEARSPISNPTSIYPGFDKLLAENSSISLFSMESNSNNQGRVLVMTTRINDRLSSVTILDPEIHYNAENVALTMSDYSRGEIYDYMVASNIFLINHEGKVIKLDEYAPPYFRDGRRELRIVLNDRSKSEARTAGSRLTVQPLLDIHNLEAFIHESGHLFANNVNHYKVKYSSERDAAAFLETATRELRRRGFLDPKDTQVIIDIQRQNLEAYQKVYGNKGQRDGSFEVLAPQIAYTQKGTNISRFLESQQKKPPEERKTLTPKTEALVESIKDSAPKMIGDGIEVSRRYDIHGKERGQNIFDRRRHYFKTGHGLVDIDVASWGLQISVQSLDSEGRLHYKSYTVAQDEFRVVEQVQEKTEGLYKRSFDLVSSDSLKFKNPPSELEINVGTLKEAKLFITDFLDKGKKGELEDVMVKDTRDYLEKQVQEKAA